MQAQQPLHGEDFETWVKELIEGWNGLTERTEIWTQTHLLTAFTEELLFSKALSGMGVSRGEKDGQIIILICVVLILVEEKLVLKI